MGTCSYFSHMLRDARNSIAQEKIPNQLHIQVLLCGKCGALGPRRAVLERRHDCVTSRDIITLRHTSRTRAV